MYKVFLFSFITVLCLGQAEIRSQTSKPRVIVMSDGEIDDRSSMIRFLPYTFDVDVLDIIETNSIFQKRGRSKEAGSYDELVELYSSENAKLSFKHQRFANREQFIYYIQ